MVAFAASKVAELRRHLFGHFLSMAGSVPCAMGAPAWPSQPADAPGAASAQLQSGLLVGLVLRHRRSAVVVMQSADATCCWRLARSTCGRWAAFQEAVVVEHCSPAAFQTARAQGGFCRAAWAPFSVCPLAGALAASGAFRTKVRPSLPS